MNGKTITKSLSKNKTENMLKIDTSLINKDEVFRMLALAHATGMPILLVGGPGTGKTKTVIDYAKAWLLSNVDPKDPEAVKKAKSSFMEKVYILETDEGTKSSEVKGHPDFEELFTNNRYKLNAPITEAEVVIINEVDKASSNIRNSLLGIMNERFLFNGKHKVPCKWKLFIATCNEIPKEEEKSPFWDRFILKMTVNRIGNGDMMKYYTQGAKKFTQTLSLGIPNEAELDTVEVPIPKLEKFLDVGYSRCTDRTLTFVPTLARAVSFIWNISVDKALVKVAGLMIDNKAATELTEKLMNVELKTVMTKVDMLWTIDNAEGIDQAMAELEGLMTGFAASGKIDASQVAEVEASIKYVLENHPIHQKGDQVEEAVGDMLEMGQI